MKMIALQAEEKVIAKIRKHWLVFFGENFGLLVAALVPIALLAIPFSALSELLPTLDGVHVAALEAFFVSGLELLFFFIFMISLTTYYLDVIIVTNKRILDIDQLGLFSRNAVSMPLEKIEDIKIETSGILAEIFKFGSLDIQTAGEMKEVHVRGIRHPERVRDTIMDAYHANKHDLPR